MIEVEKKFILSGPELAKLIVGAELIGEKSFVDIYYDNASFALTKADTWLRSRDGRFELKVPLRAHSGTSMDQYEELETEDAIKEKLKIITREALKGVLPVLGYNKFATIATTRTKYKKEGFGIDVDAVDFGYNVVEIELMVSKKEDVEKASEKIVAFAASCGLQIERVRGKVVEYIRRNNLEHFKALELAWGVKL